MGFPGRVCAWVAAAAVVAVAGSPPAARQRSEVREFVLKQIQLPHHYYYREMYLPQATTGPGSAASAGGPRRAPRRCRARRR